MVRLKDIAARAGVSIMTVSKVMRNASDISEKTKARVRQIAQEMGYVPDSMAQGLRTRRTKLFGLVISTIANPIYARTAMALEERAQELGYGLILSHSLNEVEREENCIRSLLSRRVDGLFISPVYRLAPTARVYQELERNGTPTVLLGHQAPFCSQFLSVACDDLTAAHALTQHLLQLGHRRIAFFAGPMAAEWALQRRDGYCKALREADIEVDDRLIFSSGRTIEDGRDSARQMLAESIRPTAIQAVNDLVAIGAATELLNRGVRIPQDVSITGFGDILTSCHSQVPLTTARQPKFRLGDSAMELMVKLLQGEAVESRSLSADLIVRASTGPVSGAIPPGTTEA
jgi:DNA-binding LacI/PurR family transcriptional regulator